MLFVLLIIDSNVCVCDRDSMYVDACGCRNVYGRLPVLTEKFWLSSNLPVTAFKYQQILLY
jgi:hypothetical protein